MPTTGQEKDRAEDQSGKKYILISSLVSPQEKVQILSSRNGSAEQCDEVNEQILFLSLDSRAQS